MRKLKPSDQISNDLIELLLQSENTSKNILDEFIRKTVRKQIQIILEEEVQQYLGRDYYERVSKVSDNNTDQDTEEEIHEETRQSLNIFKPVYRNGYENFTLKTSTGKIPVSVPQLRNTEEPYRSSFIQNNKQLSPEFEEMVTQMYLRGCSTRDIERILVDQTGKPILSKSSVSNITQKLKEDYEEFVNADLSELDAVYLFVDGVYESMRMQKSKKEAILCAWAITSDGTKQMLHLRLGNKESYEVWKEFFEDMLKRGLREPLLVVSDGSVGLKKALAEVFSFSKHQRCIAHKLRNIANKLPDESRDRVIEKIRDVYYQSDKHLAEDLAAKVIDQYSNEYPSAIKCFQDEFESCISFMEFPKSHHKFIWTTNVLERAFEEQKRRTKVIPRFFNERSCMNLVFGTLIQISQDWKAIKMSYYDKTLLKKIRKLFGWQEEGDFISKKIAA